jgi:hypothetical protein
MEAQVEANRIGLAKDHVISKMYYDLAGHGSMKKTYEYANKKNKTITEADVKDWFYRNIQRKNDLAGYNSFIATDPQEEYQIDLMFFADLKDPEYEGGLLMVDAFTKFATIIPMKSHNAPAYLEALKAGIVKMGGKPETLYSDEEGALSTPLIKNYLAQEDIRLLMTRGHAGLAERTIRTLKNMIYSRIDSAKTRDNITKRWIDVLFASLLTYNHVDKHSTIKMTPAEAIKTKNHLQVKVNLELKRRHTRTYPDLRAGDTVRFRTKKDKLDKERKPVWSKETYVIQHTITSFGQTLFHLPLRPGEGRTPKDFIRSDLLKVS